MNAETIASLTTAGGTLVLAVATFLSTRSANRSSRLAEMSVLAGLRPVLLNAHLEDPKQKIGFGDQHWVAVEGSGAVIDVTDDVVYLAIALRNAGAGIAVLQSWFPTAERVMGMDPPADPDAFRRLGRDLYIPPGELGFWLGALRDPSDPLWDQFAAAARERKSVTIDILYTDVHGAQPTISRFSLTPALEDRWMASVSRHWMLDGTTPR